MKKIFIFGRGEYFKNKYLSFKNRYEICGFIDNAVEDESRDEALDVPIYNPRKLTELPQYDIYCVSAAFVSMWKQLKMLGIDDERIKFGVAIEPLQPGIEEEAFSDGESLESRGEKLLYLSPKYGDRVVTSQDDLKEIIREIKKNENSDIGLIQQLSTKPVSKVFGSERGKAVDRYYIEEFLQENAEYIYGVVMEVANNNYTKMYGRDKVSKSVVSHVKGWGKDSVVCNFETGEGVVENSIDCLICTQTLQYIFDLSSAIKNIYKMLKPGGAALITVPGIKPLCEYDNDKWGEQWSFTYNCLKKLCSMVASEDDYKVIQYGNAKIATAYLYGLCVEELKTSDFEYQDSQYPFLICARITKQRERI